MVTGEIIAYAVHVPPSLSPSSQKRLSVAASSGNTVKISVRLYGVRVSHPRASSASVEVRLRQMRRWVTSPKWRKPRAAMMRG